MSKGIRLSKRHGLNPSLMKCFFCGEDTGVALFGHLPGDEAAPISCCDHQPCSKCQEYMRQGIVLMSVDEKRTTDPQNPYRSGAIAVVKEEAIKRMITSPDLIDHVCRVRFAFVPDDAWDLLGLPRGKTADKEQHEDQVGPIPLESERGARADSDPRPVGDV